MMDFCQNFGKFPEDVHTVNEKLCMEKDSI